MYLPRFIAFCGNPTSGKSEAQDILRAHHDVMPIDDGAPMRDFAVDNCGCTRAQVSTQEGKKETVRIGDKDWVVRDLLGQLGNHFEAMFGPDAMPIMAVNRIELEEESAARTRRLCGQRPLVRPVSYSFGSVRRKQGHYYVARGGVVIEIVNPLAGPSPYEFDQFDPSAVTYQIQNDGLAQGMTKEEARADLRMKLELTLTLHASLMRDAGLEPERLAA